MVDFQNSQPRIQHFRTKFLPFPPISDAVDPSVCDLRLSLQHRSLSLLFVQNGSSSSRNRRNGAERVSPRKRIKFAELGRPLGHQPRTTFTEARALLVTLTYIFGWGCTGNRVPHCCFRESNRPIFVYPVSVR